MENRIKKIFEILILTIYTFFTLKIVHPFLTYKMPDYVSGHIMQENILVLLNRNLSAIAIGLFLNAVLIIYLKVLPKRYIEAIVLAVYTFINFKLLSIILFNFDEAMLPFIWWGINPPNFLGLFIGLFLNIGLIFYWLRRK